jgi:hypothetical protein
MNMRATLDYLNQQGFAFCPPIYSEAEISDIVKTIEINTKDKASGDPIIYLRYVDFC